MQNGGESGGPIEIEDPWGCFALKLMEWEPDRVLADVLCPTVGHHPQHEQVSATRPLRRAVVGAPRYT